MKHRDREITDGSDGCAQYLLMVLIFFSLIILAIDYAAGHP